MEMEIGAGGGEEGGGDREVGERGIGVAMEEVSDEDL